ncbi:unnamed protein product, partial [Medioppia subpectinata]
VRGHFIKMLIVIGLGAGKQVVLLGRAGGGGGGCGGLPVARVVGLGCGCSCVWIKAGMCSGIKTEKELEDYFKFMTEQLKATLPMVDVMIEHESHAGMKAKLKVAKKHIEQLIKRKDALRKQCKDHKKSVAECCKLAEDMRTEMQIYQINSQAIPK